MNKKNLEARPNNWVEEIPDYIPGKHKGAGVGPVVVLSANENPFGSSPNIEAVKKIPNHRYPDSLAVKLRQTIADFYQMQPNQISVGAGSDEVLLAIAKSFLSAGRTGIYSQYGFSVYPIAIKGMGANVVAAPEKKNDEGNFVTDLDAIIKLVDDKTSVIFLANPNNPTGTMVALAEVKKFLAALPPRVLLVLDVAYAEYVDDAGYNQGVMRLADEFPNVVIVRTFSKIYGMASLRLGFCAGDERVIRVVNKLCNVFSTSQIAQNAGVVAMADQDFITRSRDHNASEKLRMQGVLRQNGFIVYNSDTNFYLMQFGDVARATNFIEFMESHNVFVRGMKSYNLNTTVRVTVGTKDENDIFLKWANEW
ncbi:MAG: histidinol-phosphate transaminase, partial [Hydrotalea sp.]|nr:histidinol-phosphate transaminase [Hydrotalea sp.]